MRKVPLILSLLLIGALLSFALFAPVSADTPTKETTPTQTDSEEARSLDDRAIEVDLLGPIGLYNFTTITDTYTALTGDTPFAVNGGAGTLDDGISADQTIPFTFNFGGTDYTTYRVNSNGWLGFGSPTGMNVYSALSSVNNVIAFVSRDMNNTGAVYSSVTEGTAPNRIHKIQAQNFYRYNEPGDTGNAQIWLYETSNVIEIRYGAFATWTNVSGTAQAGLRGASSGTTDVLSLSGAGTGAWQNVIAGNSSTATVSLFGSVVPDSGRVYRFEPVLAPNLVASSKTAVPTLVRTGEVIDYQIVIRNTGDDAATAANMSDPIPTGAAYVPGSLATDGSPAATYDMGTNTIQWGAADLAPSAAVTVTFQVTATAVSGVNIVNTATISATNVAAAVVRTTTTPVVGCVDDTFYTCADSLTPGGPTFTWYSAISGTLLMDTAASWDDGEANVTLPFPFTYYGTTSTDIRVGNNGAILFGVTSGDVSAGNGAMSAAPANFIAPFWDDIDSDTGGVYTDTFGIEPNRVVVVEWNNRPHYSNVGAATFQVLFFEGTNDLVFQYQDVDFGNALYNNGASATVGIKGSTIQYSYNQPALSDGLAIQFTRIPQASIELTKTVGTDPGTCALTDAITLSPSGGDVTYCYTVENTGEVTFDLHDLDDTELGNLLTAFSYSLAPGATAFLTQTVNITVTTVNTATWTAYNAGPTDLVTATDTATVTVPDSAFVRVAHLAPFAMDPGTAVTITLNGAPALTDFAYGDSTPYLQVAAGNVDVEVIPAGSSTPVITDTLTLSLGVYYTVVAYGDDANQTLGLLALEDDNTAPAAGNFHLRLGHLAPFAAGSATADIRLQDGTPVITDVNFTDVSAYIPLSAGTYDLKITTPGGATTLIDPAPATFAEGDIVTAFATGDGSNQDLGVFAYPVDIEGFFLRLAVAEITLAKTVGTDSSACATTDAISVLAGTAVTYCYTVENIGDLELNLHDLVDSELGTILNGLSYALAPGASVFVTETATINATTVNTATWTAYNAGPINVATASDTATVTVVTPSNGLPLEDFNAGTAGFPPAGWSVVNNGGTCVWESTETTGYPNLTGGTGFAAEANSDDCGSGTTMNTELRTPFFNLTGATSPVLVYRYDYRDLGVADQGTVDISTDGGATWTNLVTYLVSDRGPAQNVVDLSAYIGEPLLQLRFTYFAPGWDWWFQIDDVAVLLEGDPAIAVTPDSLASSQLPDTVNTRLLNIANIGSADLTWDIVEAPAACTTPDDIPWLSVDPISGITLAGDDDDVTVTFDSTGLAVDTYNGTICVESDDPNMPVMAVPVELVVEPTPPDIAVAPAALTAVLNPDTTIASTLTISNFGMLDLEWIIGEQESGAVVDTAAAEAARAAALALMPIEVDSPNFDCAAYRNYAGAEPEGYAENCLRFPGGQPMATGSFRAPTDMGFAQDIGFISDNFVSFTLNDFPGQTTLGTSTNAYYGMDFDPSATTLYALNDTTDELGTIDLATGAFTALVPAPAPGGGNWTGLSIDPVSGVFYASTTTNLYTLDPSTGDYTLIGPFGTTLMIDIAVNADGEMYGHDIGTDSIYQIDTATGTATLVGLTGFNGNFAQGMDFDNQDGTLYIFLYISGGANVYGTVDLTTGAVTPLATDNPLGEFEGATMTTALEPCDDDLSWISVNPISGTVAGGAAADVTVTFDATGLEIGVYTGNLCVDSNDPDTLRVTVPVTMTVEPALDTYGVELFAAVTAQSAEVGTTVTYTLMLTNTGTTTDTFDLAATGVWTTTLSDNSVTLAAGASTTLVVTVVIPAGAADGDDDAAVVTATSQTDAAATDSVTLTTTAVVTAPPMSYIYLPFIIRQP